MASIYDVSPNELIERAAVELAKMPEIAPPEWAKFVKTGHFRQRPPVREDWWYVRSAAVLRSICKLGPIGVAKLRTKYGGKKGRGHKTEKFCRGSGNILRKILQQLETARLVKQATIGVHKGRVITPQGRSLLDKLATEIAGPRPEKPSWALKRKIIVKKEVSEKPKRRKAAEKKEGASLKPKPEVKKPAGEVTPEGSEVAGEQEAVPEAMAEVKEAKKAPKKASKRAPKKAKAPVKVEQKEEQKEEQKVEPAAEPEKGSDL